jgi:hypothetical protein
MYNACKKVEQISLHPTHTKTTFLMQMCLMKCAKNNQKLSKYDFSTMQDFQFVSLEL